MGLIKHYHIAKSLLYSERSPYARDLVHKQSDLKLRTESGNIRLIPEANSFHRPNDNVIVDSHLTNSYWGSYKRKHKKVRRNELCPCGSNLKFKLCCINKQKDWK